MTPPGTATTFIVMSRRRRCLPQIRSGRSNLLRYERGIDVVWKHIAPALSILAIFAVIYFGAYYATVDRGVVVDLGMWNTFPSYAVGGDTAAWLFEPAHSLDREIRPLYWHSGTLPLDGTARAELGEVNLF